MLGTRLARLKIVGFTSIEFLDFEPCSLNVLIGPNGAGKSNFIAFFRFLSWMLGSSEGGLQTHVGELGGASAVLHDGAGVTPQIEAEVQLETDMGRNDYSFRLFFGGEDTLVFADEKSRFSRRDAPTKANWTQHGTGHKEAHILRSEHKTSTVIVSLLRSMIVYQFHNTSRTSRMRTRWNVDDGRYLKEDGGNIAAYLLYLRNTHTTHYRRIVRNLQALLPFFDDFILEEEYGRVLLRWKEKRCDMEFNASAASDGMLRTMALVSLLGQPPERFPNVLFLDEPELGLHPAAINLVAGLVKKASLHSQVFIATQSTDFLNCFDAEDVIVTDRKERKSTYRRLDADSLADWLEDYSLGELWEKNVLGGKP